MCGIAAVVSRSRESAARVELALAVQNHRGPDGRGTEVVEVGRWNVGLAHSRLSILDLSEAGRQPMALPGEVGSIIFNGEIYNYLELREELRALGHTFRSECDTEVLLTALHEWGPEKALNRFNGMWAFAWLDRSSRRLILARDRVGIKPMHVVSVGDEIIVASELKTVLALMRRRAALNLQVVGEYLSQSLLEVSNQTIFEDVERLPAAHYAELDLDSDRLELRRHRYWSVPTDADPPESETKLIEKLQETFADSVGLRLRSDVPVGVLLSGGVDSSAIAVTMQRILGKGSNLNLLSSVSEDPRFDETPYIDIMTRYLDCPAHKVRLDFPPEKALEYLRIASWVNDEPVGSFANVAHYLLMEQARNLGITVVLSGQGGDELLCGYKKYLGFYVQYLARRRRYAEALRVLYTFWRQGTILSQFNLGEAKRYLPRRLQRSNGSILGGHLSAYRPVPMGLTDGMTVQERQGTDVTTFSVPALTHYEDRFSMAWSREIRVPFLDHRMVEMLVPLPVDSKIHDGWTKYVFRKAMVPYLPGEIVWRKDKRGFVNPQSEWLKKDLRDVVRSHFASDSLIFKHGLVDRRPLLEKYDAFLRQRVGAGSIGYKEIFNPFALEVWLRRFESHIAF